MSDLIIVAKTIAYFLAHVMFLLSAMQADRTSDRRDLMVYWFVAACYWFTVMLYWGMNLCV